MIVNMRAKLRCESCVTPYQALSDVFFTSVLSNNSKLIFYSATMPLLSVLWAVLSLFIVIRRTMHPISALITSIILFIGWVNQVAFWYTCEPSYVWASPKDFCPTYDLTEYQIAYWNISGLGTGKNSLGVLVIIFLAAFIALASIAVSTCRKGSPPGYTFSMHPGPRDGGEAYEMGHTMGQGSETLNSDQREEFRDYVQHALERKNEAVIERNRNGLDSYKIAASKMTPV